MALSKERREKAFQASLSWDFFLNTMEVNREQIEKNYASYSLSRSNLDAIAKWKPMDVIVLAHDWCGDVVANLPLFAKIETETRKLKLHILLKDPDNTDIGKLYPHADGDVHIPIYLFFDKEGKELGHFIERTKELDSKVHEWIDDFWNEHPTYEGKGIPFSDLSVEVKKGLLEKLTTERPTMRELEKITIIDLVSRL